MAKHQRAADLASGPSTEVAGPKQWFGGTLAFSRLTA
jgi:hypothetical protein